MFDHPIQYTFGDITYRLNRKLPLPIRKVYSLAAECVSYQKLGCILYMYEKTKSALNLKQAFKIAHWYFKDPFIYCKKGVFSKNICKKMPSISHTHSSKTRKCKFAESLVVIPNWLLGRSQVVTLSCFDTHTHKL